MKSNRKYGIGIVVNYIPKEDDEEARNNGATVLPATIVRTWEGTSYENDEVNLKVHTDGEKDVWRTSVPYSETNEPGTWHWPKIR